MQQRKLRIGIELHGKLNVYDSAHMSIKVVKSCDTKQNQAQVNILNLTPDHQDYLVTECSQWNPHQSPKIFTIEMGNEHGLERIFVGEAISAVSTPPPDRMLTLKSRTGESARFLWGGISAGRSTRLSQLAQMIAEEFKLTLQFEATDKMIGNFTHNGVMYDQLKRLEGVGDVDVFVNDTQLVVKDIGDSLPGEVKLVSEHTGMIGVPVLDDKGVRVRVMFDQYFDLGKGIEVKSIVNPAADGQYTIYQMVYDASNYDKPWYIELHCNNERIKSIAKEKEAKKQNEAKSKA